MFDSSNPLHQNKYERFSAARFFAPSERVQRRSISLPVRAIREGFTFTGREFVGPDEPRGEHGSGGRIEAKIRQRPSSHIQRHCGEILLSEFKEEAT
ncbi:MAG: hypothetical protein ACTHK9_00050 [Nitrobacter sp.]